VLVAASVQTAPAGQHTVPQGFSWLVQHTPRAGSAHVSVVVQQVVPQGTVAVAQHVLDGASPQKLPGAQQAVPHPLEPFAQHTPALHAFPVPQPTLSSLQVVVDSPGLHHSQAFIGL
jgi:hypothetical protein